jgi:arsenite methyltransferase
MEKEELKKAIKDGYGKIAEKDCNCGCHTMDKLDISKSIGYSTDEINALHDANMGLGCGNPTALAEIRKGSTVLDLGSGAGFDCFLAAKKVGVTGRVIGVDMTEQMIEKARENAEKYGYENVEFRLGDIEELPVEDESVDYIISNCVINLAPDKAKVFRQAYRVLRKGGKMILSDMVLLNELSSEQRKDYKLLVSCVAQACLKEEYILMVEAAGFKVKIHSEDKGISERQYGGLPVTSLTLMAEKN